MMKTWDQEYESLPLEQKLIIRRWKKGVKERNGLCKDRNQCPGCGEFFSSTSAFDKHRVGSFGGNGKKANRRCLTLEEMTKKGFVKSFYFYWVHGSNPLYADNASD